VTTLRSIDGGKSPRVRREDGAQGRVPPHNLDAEAAVVGSMLYNPASVAIALPLLKESDFYRTAHGIVFRTVADVTEAGNTADPVTVADHLERAGQLDDIGGPAHLVELQAGGCVSSAVAGYAAIVARHAQSRRIIALAGELAEAGYDHVDPAVIVTKLKDDVDELLGATNRRNRLFNAADHIDEHLETIEARAADDRERITGIRTEWHDLDTLIGGLRPGQLVVIAGRPAMGKSAVAAGIALRTVIAAGMRVLTVSIEMSFEELLDRYVAAVGHIDLTKVRSGTRDAEDLAKVNDVAMKLAEKNLWVLDDPNATLPAIHAAAQRIEADLVIVDYLQIAKTLEGAKNRTREREVAELSGGLKRMARDLGIPIVALSQFNRDPDSRHSDKRPQLTDLRESGAIENDSDVVIGLFREDYYNPECSMRDRGVLEMIVLKQRNGPTGTARLKFEAHTGWIGNLPRGGQF
jgi:replicative DNA helicase